MIIIVVVQLHRNWQEGARRDPHRFQSRRKLPALMGGKSEPLLPMETGRNLCHFHGSQEKPMPILEAGASHTTLGGWREPPLLPMEGGDLEVLYVHSLVVTGTP